MDNGCAAPGFAVQHRTDRFPGLENSSVKLPRSGDLILRRQLRSGPGHVVILLGISALGSGKEVEEFSAGRIKRTLLFLRAMVDQWPALFIEGLEQKILCWKLSELGRFVHVADQLTPQHPQVAYVLADRIAG